jgi:hypothetical protein
MPVVAAILRTLKPPEFEKYVLPAVSLQTPCGLRVVAREATPPSPEEVYSPVPIRVEIMY